MEVLGDALNQDVDLLVETNGGSTDATEAIISLLRQTTSSFRVIVANGAKSNGTLLALAASSILMGPTSELGPIEPSVGGFPASTLMQDFVRDKDFGLHIAGSHALRQSIMLAKRLLTGGMMKGETPERIEQAVNALCTRESYPSHGSVIDRDEAATLGLSIERGEIGDPLWDRVWLLYCMLDYDSRRAGHAKLFEGHSRSLAVSALPNPTTS